MTEGLDWIARSGARAKGKRPAYFDDPGADQFLSMLLALVGEVSVLRERLDTVERLLEARGGLSREEVERYAPDPDAAYERGMETKAYIARVMRGVQQAMEAMAATDERPLDEVSRELRDL